MPDTRRWYTRTVRGGNWVPNHESDSLTRNRIAHTAYKQPDRAHQEPHTAYKQPDRAYQEPYTAYKQPDRAYQEPHTAYKQPDRAHEEPDLREDSCAICGVDTDTNDEGDTFTSDQVAHRANQSAILPEGGYSLGKGWSIALLDWAVWPAEMGMVQWTLHQ